MSETSGSLKIVVVSPEETVVETTADFVVLPLFDGEFGVLPGHSPMIGRLGFGELRIKQGAETTHYYVDGGFAQVTGNEISVLTDRAIPGADIDVAAAEEQLKEGISREAKTPQEAAARDRAVSQARAQLRLAGKSE